MFTNVNCLSVNLLIYVFVVYMYWESIVKDEGLECYFLEQL